MIRRLFPLVLGAACVILALPGVSHGAVDHGPLHPMTFPVIGKVSYTDTWQAPRSGHLHEGQDLMGTKMMPEVAAADGWVTTMTIPEPSYGYMLVITGDDGWSYHYLHINNDTPGTDDGKAELKDVFAPGLEKGDRVNAGQLVAFMGDSGNAESTGPHLHFELHDPSGAPVNAYASLKAAPAITTPAPPAPKVPKLPRLAGADRVGTAIAASKSGWSSAATVVLAGGDQYAEALPASVLAAKKSGPLLLTTGDSVPDEVLDEIARLKATTVIVIGSVPTAADALLQEKGLEVTRIAGADAPATAAAIADALGTTGKAVLVNTERFADGISGAGLAAGRGWPILLAGEHDLPQATADALAAHKVTTTYVVGGTAVIGDEVAALAPGATRLAGDDRYGTSVAVAEEILDLGGRSLSRTYLATGWSYPDALTAGTLAARSKGIVLLVDGTGNATDGATQAFLNEHSGQVALKAVMGGIAAVNIDATVSIAKLFGL